MLKRLLKRGNPPPDGGLPPETESLLAEAQTLLESGALEEAVSTYRRLLEHHPTLARGHYNLGLARERLGELDTAEADLRKAVELAPDNAIPVNGLGEFLFRRSRYDEAAECFRRAGMLDPTQALYPCNLSAALNAVGRSRVGAQEAVRAIRLDSDLAEAHNNHGIARAALGEHALAEQAFRYALGLRPGFSECAANLLTLLLEQGRVGEAGRSLERLATEIRQHPGIRVLEAEILIRRGNEVAAEEILLQIVHPDRAGAVRCLFDLYREQGRHEEALALLEEYPRPGEPDYWLDLARLRLYLLDGEGALEACLKAGRLRPDNDQIEYLTGIVHGTLGQRQEAARLYHRILERTPGHAPALRQLVEMTRQRDQAVALLQAIGPCVPKDEDHRIEHHFARGRLLDLCGEHEAAFREFQTANRLKFAQSDQGLDQTLEFMEKTMAVFDRDYFERHAPRGVDDERPVFIVGMPRSGSTLVERILSSHSRVAGRGERKALLASFRAWRSRTGCEAPYPECLEGMGAEALAEIARDYLSRMVTDRTPALLRITDKMLFNFQYLGLVALLFPRARVVHCRRDPLDTCLSCYFQHFSEGNEFSYDLAALGAFYRQYQRLMRHWSDTLPLPVHEVRYEALVEDPEGGARGLIEFLGLEWEPECLEIGRSGTTVATASVYQVRRPIYSVSCGRWRHYEPWLEPLIQALDDAGQRIR